MRARRQRRDTRATRRSGLSVDGCAGGRRYTRYAIAPSANPPYEAPLLRRLQHAFAHRLHLGGAELGPHSATSSEIVEIARGVDHAHDLGATVDGAIEDQVCAERKRPQVRAQLGASPAYQGTAGEPLALRVD